MRKKFLSLLLILSMAAAFIPFAGSAKVRADVTGFPDVTSETVNTTAYKAIYWAAGEGIIKGFGDGTFRPEDSCTREQFVVMIWRLNEKPLAESTVSFTDVDSSRSTYKAMQWAVEQGIIKGFSDGSFRPEDKVTREQVAIMLWRMAGKPEVIPGEEGSETGVSFSDFSEEKSTWPAVAWGVSAGLIKGFPDGTFGPEQDCQRQQIAIFLYRYVKNVLGKEPEVPDVTPGGSTDPEKGEDPAGKVAVWQLRTRNDIRNTMEIEFEYDDLGRVTKVTNQNTSESMLVSYENKNLVQIGGEGSYRLCNSVYIDYNDDGIVTSVMGYKDDTMLLDERFNPDGRPQYEKEFYESGELARWTVYEYSGGVPANVVTEKILDKDSNVQSGFSRTPVYDEKGRVKEELFTDLDENPIGKRTYIYAGDSEEWTECHEYEGESELRNIIRKTEGDTFTETEYTWNGEKFEEYRKEVTTYNKDGEEIFFEKYFLGSDKPAEMRQTTISKDTEIISKTVTFIELIGDSDYTSKTEYYVQVELDEYPPAYVDEHRFFEF